MAIVLLLDFYRSMLPYHNAIETKNGIDHMASYIQIAVKLAFRIISTKIIRYNGVVDYANDERSSSTKAGYFIHDDNDYHYSYTTTTDNGN